LGNSPLIVDLRNSNIIYKDLLIYVKDMFKKEYVKLIMITYKDIGNYLNYDSEDKDCCLFSSSDALFLYLEKFIKETDNVCVINLPKELSIGSLGKNFNKAEFEKK
jgi:hypothetical protein